MTSLPNKLPLATRVLDVSHNNVYLFLLDLQIKLFLNYIMYIENTTYRLEEERWYVQNFQK